jgi:dihydropteroate synthase
MLTLGPRSVAPGEFAVMAIVNRTPDSFYEPGRSADLRAALEAVDRAVDEGADLVDVGGVRAGYGPGVDAAEELDRVLPVVGAVRERFPDLAISVDTWRAVVAERASAEGANLINDTWAGADPDLVGVAAAAGAGLVCSHTGGHGPRTDPHRVTYVDVVTDVVAAVTAAAENAVAAGVRPDGILIDPTHDFGKNTRHSLELTRRLDELVATAGRCWSHCPARTSSARRSTCPSTIASRARWPQRRSPPGTAPGCSGRTMWAPRAECWTWSPRSAGRDRRPSPDADWPELVAPPDWGRLKQPDLVTPALRGVTGA